MSDQSSSGATRTPESFACRANVSVSASAADRQTVVNIDAGVAPKRIPHGQSLRRVERTGLPATIRKHLRSGDVGGERDHRDAILDQAFQRSVRPIPLQHHELRRVEGRSLAVAENIRQRKDLPLSGGQKLFHCEFGRGMQIRVVRRPVRQNERGLEPVQVGLVSRRSLEGGRLHFDETFGVEPAPHEGRNPRTGDQPGAPLAVSLTVPKGLRRRRAQRTPRQEVRHE